MDGHVSYLNLSLHSTQSVTEEHTLVLENPCVEKPNTSEQNETGKEINPEQIK